MKSLAFVVVFFSFLFFPFRFIISFAQERIEEKKEKKKIFTWRHFTSSFFSSSPPSPKKSTNNNETKELACVFYLWFFSSELSSTFPFFLIIPQKSRNHKSWPVEVLGPVVDEDVDEDVEEDVVEVVVGPCVFIIME